MESISFTPGRALLESASATSPWFVRFEDEGVAAYLYACDRSLGPGEAAILDAMLIYNVAAITANNPLARSSGHPARKHPAAERLAAIEWSRDGLQAVLYLDGAAQAMVDFGRRESFCRADFPNFLAEPGQRWRAATHAWNPAAIENFEAALYT